MHRVEEVATRVAFGETMPLQPHTRNIHFQELEDFNPGKMLCE